MSSVVAAKFQYVVACWGENTRMLPYLSYISNIRHVSTASRSRSSRTAGARSIQRPVQSPADQTLKDIWPSPTPRATRPQIWAPSPASQLPERRTFGSWGRPPTGLTAHSWSTRTQQATEGAAPGGITTKRQTGGRHQGSGVCQPWMRRRSPIFWSAYHATIML